MPNATGGNELIKADVFSKLNIVNGMHIGDLGCGNLAFFSVPAAKLVGNKGVVYAVDILKSVLQAVENLAKQEGLENFKTVWSNLEIIGATKIPEGSLDIVFLVNILFQSKKDDMVIKEAYRLMKSGGKLVIIDWLKIATPFGPPHEDRTDPQEIKKFAQDVGLTLSEEFEAGPYHYGMIFVK